MQGMGPAATTPAREVVAVRTWGDRREAVQWPDNNRQLLRQEQALTAKPQALEGLTRFVQELEQGEH